MYTEEQGIKAIIDLQGFVDIKESIEEAKKGWNSMSHREKMQTERMHTLLFGDTKNETDK
jgi:hypothetical protein